ncbi:coat protein F [Gordoniibacillus kamchatkensis]|uniref:Coat protein F n=1 Tax=Gordoniibacillus kamchatkensis TaxID=1590651 RepID=A0ABR5AFH4_9BACL|nr:spore coat protein [Paenibacillus sp. VKM B-2647]KIL39769.1 coat protein F [Paenibacillus sp. VKM B-2647]
MPFGAHETMEVHEILNEKMNAINHFMLYAEQARDPGVREMARRHLHGCMQHYDQIVAYTHDYSAAQGMGNPLGQFPRVQPEQIVYGLDNPARVAPMLQGGFTDQQILMAMLSCHKCAATNAMRASLEIADPNLRQMVMGSAIAANNDAYEVFLLMNRMGVYQVPTMHDHTAKTYLHTYQPASPQ